MLGLLLIIFLIRSYTERSRREKIHKEFPLLRNEDTLNNYVTSIYSFERFHYAKNLSFIKLNDGRVMKIYTHLNRALDNKGINDVLDVGDSLYKKAVNDSLYVKNKGSHEKFLFIIKILEL
jgi:hypothetical protein